MDLDKKQNKHRQRKWMVRITFEIFLLENEFSKRWDRQDLHGHI